MKRIGLLFVIMITLLVFPFSVLADKNTSSTDNSKNNEVEVEDENDGEDDEEKESSSKEVKVYFFHGDGCPHCEDAQEFFDSIEDEYGDLFELVAYETWYDADNADLLQQVAEAREENVTGVPYILIGNESWSGYASDYNEDIIETIEEEYEKEVTDRYDIMELIDTGETNEDKEDYSDDAMILIIILIIAAAIVAGIVFARKKTV